MHKMAIEISIVIINHNGKDYLENCIRSVQGSNNNVNLEIVVVDNGSDDYLSEIKNLVKNPFPLKLVSLDKNYGPAMARNIGVANSVGKYIGFLDNDTEVDKNWADLALREFTKNKKLGIIQCKLILAKERNKLDYVGEYIGTNGFLVQRAQAGEIDNSQYENKIIILAAKSAGMFIRRKTFFEAGQFDSDYFIYVEETDLGWRSWLVGYEAKYIPKSIVYHHFGTSSIILDKKVNDRNAKFHGTKNYILTLIKNLENINLIKILPVHVALWEGLAFYSLIVKRNFNNFKWINQGIFWNITNLNTSILKRNDINNRRLVSDKILLPKLMVKKPFFYFINKVITKQKVGNAEGFNKTK